MKYIVNDYLDTYGGSTTLLLRMAEWAKRTKNMFLIYTPKAGNKEIVAKLKSLCVEIFVFDTGNIKLLEQNILRDCESECTCISFIFKQYMDIEIIKKKTNSTFKNCLYAIHPDTYLKGLGYSNKVCQKIIKGMYKPLISKLNVSGGMLCMDNDILGRTESYYGLNLSRHMHIQLLPMIIPYYTELELNEKIAKSFKSKTIISACRADFPYKGYVFGLLEAFETLKKEYTDISLELICSGEKDDVDKLKDKILTLSNETRECIRYHKWMDYADLKDLIGNCFVSIGMGTAIIDAAVECVPSIAVKYNTFDFIGNHIFYEKPELLVAYEGNAIDQLRRLLDMDFEEYHNVAVKCYKAVKFHYNIDAFFEYINSIDENKSKLSHFDVILHSLNSYINSRKHLKEYSVSAIEKED